MTTPYTAEWYLEKANKIKADTWKTSDRFTDMDKGGRLDLQLTNSLQDLKPLLKQIKDNPILAYGMPAGAKRAISTLNKFAPSLFTEAEPIVKPKTYLEGQQETAGNKIEQLGLTGILKKPGEALIAASEKGYLPDLTNNNWLGAMKQGFMFPLNKLMQTLSVEARAGAAGLNKSFDYAFESSGAKAKGINNIIDLINSRKKDNIGFGDTLTYLSENLPESIIGGLKAFGQGAKEATIAGYEPIINNKSKYAGTGYTQFYENQFPGTMFTKKATEYGSIPESWKNGNIMQQVAYFADKNVRGNETGNWWQRLISGFAGSPADVAGFASDVFLSPSSFVTGGLNTGAKTGVNLTKDLIIEGEKILPKAAEIGLNKTGLTALEAFTTAKYGNEIEGVLKGVIKSASGATDVVAKQTLLNAIKNKAVNEFMQAIPDTVTAYKYLDLGGTKFMGTTIIPGYKYAQKGQAFEKTAVGDLVQKAFNAKAGIPQEFRANFDWVLSAGEAEKSALIKDFATVIKDSNEADLAKVKKYLWLQSDVERMTNKLDTFYVNLDNFKAANPNIDNIKNTYKALQKSYAQPAKDIYGQLDDVEKQIIKIQDKIEKEASNVIIPKEFTAEFKDKLQSIEGYITDSGGIKYTRDMADEYRRLPFNLKAKSGYPNASSLDEMAADIANAFPEYNINSGRDLINTLKDLRDKAKNGYSEVYNFTDTEIKEMFDDMFLEDFRTQSSVPGFAGEFKKNSIADLVLRKNELEESLANPSQLNLGVDTKAISEAITNKKLLSQYGSLKTAPKRISATLDKYANQIKELALTDKQISTANNLADYWSRVAQYHLEATGEAIDKYKFYTPIRHEQGEVGIPKKSTVLGAVEQPFMKERTVTMAQADKLGLKSKELVPSSTQRLFEEEKSVFRSRLLSEVRQYGSDTPVEGMVKVEGIPELKNFYIKPEYESMLKKTFSAFFSDEATNKILKIYDKGLTIWKRWALATPGFHFRNFFTDNVSGLQEWGVQFYNPKNWEDGINGLRGVGNDITIFGGKKLTAKQLYDEMVEAGVNVTQSSFEGGTSSKLMNKISPAEWSLKFGNKRESLGRAIGYVIERKNGSSKIIAASKIKAVYFDYLHSLTPIEKNIGRRIVPFLTWLKNNIRRQVELVLTRTGGYATIPKAMNFVENISDIPADYNEFKPAKYTDSAAFATPFRNPGLPDWWADIMKKQRTTTAGNMLVANPNLGFQDWSKLDFKDMFSSISPFIKVPIELLTDTNVYYGSKINENQKNKEVAAPVAAMLRLLPDNLLTKLGITKTNDGKILISPRADYLLKQLPQYALTQRAFAGTESSPFQNLSMLGGIKFFPYNEEQAKETYTADWLTQANDNLNDFIQKQGKGYTLPATNDITSSYKEIYRQYMAKKYNIANAEELKNITKYAGSNAEIDLVIKLINKPYNDEMDKLKDKSLPELSKILSDLGIYPTLQEVNTILNQLKTQ